MRYHIHSLLTTIYERDSRGRVLSYDRIVDGVTLKNIRYEYDKLGQLAGRYAYGADASSPVLSQSYAYSIQGWMKKNSVRASYGSIFDESLVRDSEGRDALFSGRIRSAEYRHLDDLQMRDEAEPWRFDYIGNRRVEYQYDRNGSIISFGNVNILNLPYEQGLNIYKYLADGMKFEKRDTSGKGLRYSGAFVFNLSSSSQASVESVAFPEGRICFKDGGEIVDEWYVKDHVGSVRSIVDLGASVAEEAILFQSDYSPYGRRVVTVRRDDTESNRYGFGGKESSIEGNPDVFLDFGARYWSPVFYTWLSRDPKADSYCSVSPYVYCAGDPVNFVDPKGEALYYTRTGDLLADDGEDDNRIFFMDDLNTADIHFYRFNKVLYDIQKSGLFVPYIGGNLQEVDGLIIITRNEETDTYTAGKFKTVWKGKDNKITGITGFTLERDGPDTTTPNMEKRIPEGLYQLYYYSSEKYPDHFGLFNELVPQSRLILMHTGNEFDDTKGCVLLGTEYSNGFLGHSGDKVKEVNNYLNSVSDISNYYVIIRNRF